MKAILGLLAVTSFTAVAANTTPGLPVEDGDFDCITQTQADHYIRDFNIDTDSFGGVELCDGRKETKKLFNDLRLIEEGRFNGSARNVFIRDALPANNYFAWFKEMTRGIDRGHDMPQAVAYNSGGYFTMQDGWPRHSTLGRVGTLIHEARHTEGYMHTQCTQGPYKDMFLQGCDSSINEGGSHGIEMEYYSRVVLQGENFHPVYRQMARLMNLARANFVFNQDPMTESEGLAAAAGRELVLLDKDGRTGRKQIAELEQLKLHRTSLGASLLGDGRFIAVDLYDGGNETLKDEFSYFKILINPATGEVADLQEIDIANRRYLVALGANGQLRTYDFAAGGWSRPVQATDLASLATTAPDGSEGLFAVTHQGQVERLDPRNLRRGPSAGRWPEGARALVKWQNSLLIVGEDGQVIQADNGKTFAPFAALSVQQLVRAPLYDAFSLHIDQDAAAR
jgi:hypothetical protein